MNDPAPLPESTKLALAGTFSADKVRASPSESEELTLNSKVCPSSTNFGPMESNTGA